jgi:hypothetical protein
MIDVILNFRTTYIHPTSREEISNPKQIAKRYLKGMFWVDLLASIPFKYIAHTVKHKFIVIFYRYHYQGLKK